MTRRTVQEEVLDSFINTLREDESFDDSLAEALLKLLTPGQNVRSGDLVTLFSSEEAE